MVGGLLKWTVSRFRSSLLEIRSSLVSVFDKLEGVRVAAMTIPGWVSGEEARQIAFASWSLQRDPVIVEVGVFMGRSAALLAGARRLRGSGKVHCVDPFDCSGDGYSVPFYLREIESSGSLTLEGAFVANMAKLKLQPWIEIHRGASQNVARDWTQPIDLLLLDADYSPEGARAIFDQWVSFLKPGGILMLPNSRDRVHAAGHDGNRRLVVEELKPPRFSNIRTINELTLAERAA
jgi:predicted O-methyltransferase YrrM